MAHGLAFALSDRQTDVFPLTHSNAFLSGRAQITSEMAAWLALANFKCEMSFSVAILVHIQGRLNFILFTCCQLLAVLLQKPMPVMNTTKLPPIYLVLLESRKDKKCLLHFFPPVEIVCQLRLEHFKSNVLNKAYNNLDNQPSPVPEVPIMSQLTLSQTSSDPDNHLSSPCVEFQISVSKSFQFAVEWKCCLTMYLNHYLHIKRTEQASVYGFEDFFSSVVCLKEPLDKCVLKHALTL